MHDKMRELLDAVQNLKDVMIDINADGIVVDAVNVYGWGGSNVCLTKKQRLLPNDTFAKLGAQSYEITFDGVVVKAEVDPHGNKA